MAGTVRTRVWILGVLAAFVIRAPGRLDAAKPGRITGRWLGQDGHDYCGELTNAIKPNGVQDVHITLSGLPAWEIAQVQINGHGADAWRTDVINQFGAKLVRKPGAATADLFFEAFHPETGREFAVALYFADGSKAEVYLKGGKADSNLRMAGAGIALKWVGQELQDYTGTGPGVGSDGRIDARIAVAKLPPRDKVKAVEVEDSQHKRWASGTNPEGHHNAEFFAAPNDPTSGSLLFQPVRDLAGQKLTVTVHFESGKKDAGTVIAGRCDPLLATRRASLPTIGELKLSARWLGQEGQGDVHVALTGLPANKAVAGAILTDPVRGVWVYRAAGGRVAFEADGHALPLVFKRGADRTSADLLFPPVRDETRTTMSLRLIDSNGESLVGAFEGGACDVSRRAPVPASNGITARPGDDLNALAAQYGTVRLTKGEYRLSRPLVLPKPVNLLGEPGSTLVFSQGAGDPAWSTAIKVHSGGTTLRGFKVRFAGHVRWRPETSWGPAVIGTTDNFDVGPNPPKVHLVFEGLDIEGPPSSGEKPWEEAAKLMRLLDASCGRIVGNVLRGGVIECFEGPWIFEKNDYRGTPPATTASAVFVIHDPHDSSVSHNKVRPVGPSGKTWRFLLFTGRGGFDRVEDNVVEQVGPRDDDVVPYDNQPEIVLTESYHVRFEGKPSAVSQDGRLVRVGKLPGEPPRTGDVVSVVGGAGAGAWRRIVQRIGPDLYLLESPLPRGSEVISVTPGLVSQTFSGNTIEATGGGRAAGFVLPGNHFGLRFLNNRVIGAGEAFLLYAYASESPYGFGWTHVPFFSGIIEGNTIEDSPGGATIGVFHSPHTKSNQGRVYMTATLKGNAIRWSEPFLARSASGPSKKPRAGITLGVSGATDPGEFLAVESGTRLDAPPGTSGANAIRVEGAVVNKRPLLKTNLPVSPTAGPASASAVGDPGKSQAPPSRR